MIKSFAYTLLLADPGKARSDFRPRRKLGASNCNGNNGPLHNEL